MKGWTFMNKRFIAASLCCCALLLSACGADDAASSGAEIYNVSDVKYDTYTVEIGTIKEAYYSEAKFDYPYSQQLFIQQSGLITKIFNGSEIEEGELICEVLIEDLQKNIDEQKIILDAAKETYDSLKKSRPNSSDTEYAEINYLLEKNKYDDLIKQQEETKIYAPASGTIKIDKENCSAGGYVRDGQYLCNITDRSRTYLCAFIYGDKLNNVNFGSSVTIKQGEKVICKGKVVDMIEKNPGTDYAGFSYVIEPEKGADIKEFAKIDVVFNVYEKDNVVVVPTNAVKEVGGRTYVNVLIDGAKIETDVELGIQGDKDVEILSGLSGGEKLIINR